MVYACTTKNALMKNKSFNYQICTIDLICNAITAQGRDYQYYLWPICVLFYSSNNQLFLIFVENIPSIVALASNTDLAFLLKYPLLNADRIFV